MGTPMISAQWPRFVLPLIRKEWLQKMNAVPSPVMSLFAQETSDSSVEYSQGIGSLGEIPEYNSDTAEGKPGAIEYDKFNALYEKTFTHKEYAKGIAIERKLWDDERYGNIKRKARGLGHSFGTTRAIHAASVFNNAFSSSFLGGDGKALCADDHPTNKVDSTAVDNKGTTALSYDAVVATLNAGFGMTDDRGAPMPVIYDTLVVPGALRQTAFEIVASPLKPDTADNNANWAGAQNMSVLVDPYLTDANNWFMVDSALASIHLIWYTRISPEISVDPASDFNLVAKYRGYMRHSFGWDDFRFVYGHEVT
jgi:hypothetical protein